MSPLDVGTDTDPLIVRTFAGLRPPTRSDDLAFTSLLVEEAADDDGSPQCFETLDTITTLPGRRLVTVTNARYETAWYRLTWIDAAGAQARDSDPFRCAPSPTTKDIARLLPARTKVLTTWVGDFTDQTTPTATDVEAHIRRAKTEVLNELGYEVPDNFLERLNFAIELIAAAFIEMGTEGNLRQETDRSPGRNYRAMGRDAITALNADLERLEPLPII
jgi:hypothetical protein